MALGERCTRGNRRRLPAVAAAVMDVLPLRVRLDHAALINSATGEVIARILMP